MASSLRFLKMCLSFTMLLHFLFFISPSLSFLQLHPKNNDILLSSTLIRGLNLFPKSSINIPENDPHVLHGNIVEKKFTFPGFDDSGYSVEELGHHAGYYSLPHSKAARMFYFFFESRNSKDDPVIIWLTGGPGCGSEIALFYENGPFQFSKDKNLSLVWNEYGWDKASNIIFVDQPIGSGFSYTTDVSDDIRHDEDSISNDLYDFLQAFFKEHPQFTKNDFYITGESYAGHYIPAFASRVHQGNKAKEGIHINLKGFAIGNGLTNPDIQYMAYTDYALENGLINKDEYERINELIPPCQKATKKCDTEGGHACGTALTTCMKIFYQITNITGNTNYYDIRKKCEGAFGHCQDFSDIETLLNMKTVKEALGVGDLKFEYCSFLVHAALTEDWMKNLEVGIPALLEDGIKLLVYAGEKDLICNWLGNSRWVDAMKWSGQTTFKESPTTSFLVDSEEAGILKSHGPLAFLKVKEAGHMVPMDQPKVALQMLQDWMQGKLHSAQNQNHILVV
ncbi:serine carboxypeptidase-like [Medicago truncatula]|uniref:Carboxypeptidase n=1 Tax=Medicago truncatula TaxID=3880 RepID=G7IU65_MEDTR|nr:serine carboxypeptidase-like [Medicago truncatula]AES67521.2 serine carboxypeptidase-like protein [Medicago truncatula]